MIEAASVMEGGEARQKWSHKLDFLMSAFSSAIGMGNLWRFPYLCYRNGGGAFLIPFTIMAVLLGVPIMQFEFYLGQFSGKGVFGIWEICPILKGCGMLQFFMTFMSMTFYPVIISYAFYFLFASFAADVPWKGCDNWWNSPDCMSLEKRLLMNNCTSHNCTFVNGTCSYVGPESEEYDIANTSYISASDEYFHGNVLQISAGIGDVGVVRWQLLLCLILTWAIACATVWSGIKSAGKAAYVTAVAPYLLLLVLCVRGLMLPGAMDGIVYYVMPDITKLATVKVWGDAAVQVFFSMSLCFGGLSTLASHNHYHHKTSRDVYVLMVGDCLTSFFSGLIVFSYLGAMARRLGVDLHQVATQGPGLVFIVFPDAISLMPGATVWSVLFMAMLVFLGIGTLIVGIELISAALMDKIPALIGKQRNYLILVGVLFVVLVACGLPYITNGGMYVLQIIDSYVATYGLLAVGFFMCIAVGWIYGMPSYRRDYERMYGSPPNVVWVYMAKYISPVIIMALVILTAAEFKPSFYGSYKFPIGCDVFGWTLVAAELTVIPACAVWQIVNQPKSLSLKKRITNLFQAPNWKPRIVESAECTLEKQTVTEPLYKLQSA